MFVPSLSCIISTQYFLQTFFDALVHPLVTQKLSDPMPTRIYLYRLSVPDWIGTAYCFNLEETTF